MIFNPKKGACHLFLLYCDLANRVKTISDSDGGICLVRRRIPMNPLSSGITMSRGNRPLTLISVQKKQKSLLASSLNLMPETVGFCFKQ